MDRNIYFGRLGAYSPGVALRKESVDRNTTGCPMLKNSAVALRKESVDRNNCVSFELPFDRVALRKESVDRNT